MEVSKVLLTKGEIYKVFRELPSVGSPKANLEPLSVPITGRHSLCPSSHACITLYQPCGRSTFCNEGVIQVFHVPHE
jgi:hypothetical protein